jgi:hypothetical protein
VEISHKPEKQRLGNRGSFEVYECSKFEAAQAQGRPHSSFTEDADGMAK